MTKTLKNFCHTCNNRIGSDSEYCAECLESGAKKQESWKSTFVSDPFEPNSEESGRTDHFYTGHDESRE